LGVFSEYSLIRSGNRGRHLRVIGKSVSWVISLL
jgi:hypothetical protein